jgi:RNA polymerase sigma factor (sigma-70 family)
VNGEATSFELRAKAARTAFPEKSNPNRPAPAAGEPWRETRGESRSFSERCDPRHSHRPLTDEQRELVTQYMPLARTLARRAGGKLVDRDEMEAEAYAALVEAARTFDPDRGVNFAVHARPRITGALRDYRRFLFHANWKGARDESPVFQRLAITDDLHGRVLGMEPDEPLGRDFELPEAVASVVRRLPRSQADACRLIYFEDKSYRETAEILGCTKGCVTRLHIDTLARLRHDYREALAG